MAWTSKLLKTMQASQALLVRIMYGVHATIGVILAASFTNNFNLFFFEIFIIVSAVEYILTVKKSKKGEWKWFLPSVLIYISWLTPQIVIMEYRAKQIRTDILTNLSDTATLSSCPVNLAEVEIDISVLDVTSGPFDRADTIETHDLIRQLTILLQQSMMLVLIAGRWLGPKGELTREQLSQLLLAYVGIAADMLEFITETLSIPQVACNHTLVTLVFTIWVWSLLQYTLGLTATKQRKTRVVGTANAQQDSCGAVHGFRSFLLCCCGGEIFALMVSVVMQDGPYLAFRLYILFKLRDFGQIFFTVMNSILVFLQLYRISIVVGVIVKEKKKGKKDGGQTPEDDPPYQLKEGKEVSVISADKTEANHPPNECENGKPDIP